MKVSEIYPSLQGEGPHVGYPAIFLRLAGCNLKCPKCDSKYSWDGSKTSDMTVDEVLYDIEDFLDSDTGLVITGGEPMIQEKELEALLSRLPCCAFVDIETNGTIPYFLNAPYIKRAFRKVTFIVSPKIGSLGAVGEVDDTYFDTDAVFKFVVASLEDVGLVKEFQKKHILPSSRIMLMPEGITYNKELYTKVAEWCKLYGYRFSPRLHIILWGYKRRT